MTMRRLLSIRHATIRSTAGPTDVYTISSTGGAMRKLASDRAGELCLLLSRAGDRLWYGAAGVTIRRAYPALRFARVSTVRTCMRWCRRTPFRSGDTLLADMKEGGGVMRRRAAGRTNSRSVNADGPGYSNLRRLNLQNGCDRRPYAAEG